MSQHTLKHIKSSSQTSSNFNKLSTRKLSIQTHYETKQFLTNKLTSISPFETSKNKNPYIPPLKIDFLIKQKQSFVSPSSTNRNSDLQTVISSIKTPKIKNQKIKIISQQNMQQMHSIYLNMKKTVDRGCLSSRQFDKYLTPKIAVGKRSKRHKYKENIENIDLTKSESKILLINYVLNSPDSYNNKISVLQQLQIQYEEYDNLNQFLKNLITIYNQRMNK